MKRVLLAALIMIAGVYSVSAVRYQGFAEVYGGLYMPSKFFKVGPEIGVATTHGIEIENGVFVGLGAEFMYGNCERSGIPRNSNVDRSIRYIDAFVEGRYRILSHNKFSPFVGLRVGAGYGCSLSMQESDTIFPYISPALGYSFNFTKKVGLDLSIGYVYHGNFKYWPQLTEDPFTKFNISNNSLQLRVGVHF